MEIKTVLKKLYKTYKKGDSDLGCVSRANMLYYFMRNQGLNPKLKLFSFKNDGGERIILSHCIVILNNMVYDTNLDETQNPIEISKYEEVNKKQNPQLNLIWEEFLSDKYPIDLVWNYLPKCDEDLQKEIRSLIKEKYKNYLKKTRI